MLTELNGALDSDNGERSYFRAQELCEPVHAGRMSRPDRGHLDNLSVNQFNAIIFGENPGLDHPVIFGRRKRVSR